MVVIDDTRTSPIEDTLSYFRARIGALDVPAKLREGGKQTLADHPRAVEVVLNKLTLAIIKSPSLHSTSRETLKFACEPVIRMVKDEMDHAATASGKATLDTALRQVQQKLNLLHPFVTLNLLPRAIFHKNAGEQFPEETIQTLGNFIAEHKDQIFHGLTDIPPRAEAIQNLIAAMLKQHDARNPYPDLPPSVQLRTLQHALQIASSPLIDASRLKDYLRPYGNLMHRLIGIAQKERDGFYVLRPQENFRYDFSAADTAAQRFVDELRTIPHFTDPHCAGEDIGKHTLGSDFTEQCDRLEMVVQRLLSHPDLKQYDTQTLYRALDPVREFVVSFTETTRKDASSDPAVKEGKAPFLTHQNLAGIVGNVERVFANPKSFYADAGIVLQAQFFHDMQNLNYAMPHRFATALNNMMQYCDESRSRLFAIENVRTQPQTSHKLGLLRELCETLTRHDAPAPIQKLCAEARARLFVAAAGASTRNDPRENWTGTLAATNAMLLHEADTAQRWGRTSLLPAAELNEANPWASMMDKPSDPKKIAGPKPTVHTIVPIRGGDSLTPNGREKFEARLQRAQEGDAVPTEPAPAPTQAELNAIHGVSKGGKGELVSFADRQRQKAAAANPESSR